MSDLTTIARPYAKAAFDFAVEKSQLDQWGQMLSFAAEVAKNTQMKELLTGSVSAEKLVEVFVAVCGEQVEKWRNKCFKHFCVCLCVWV